MTVANNSYGQVVKKGDNESVDQFVNHFRPGNSKPATNVLETNWNNKPVLITFFDQEFKLSLEADPSQQNYHQLIGLIFFKTGNDNYIKYLIDTIRSEGGDPKIENILFANADKGRNKELIILVSWPQVHSDVSGILYGTYVYDDWKIEGKNKLRFLKKISSKLSGGCDCEYKDGNITKAKFKNKASILLELKKIGYRQ